ncbi:MAG TPA: AcvB/VirJ family lysyl-phosphatidylglycerol hydrolase [Vicinamibacterales bacterium]|nr:AcvB/VirJ family lysyl-phosphatidylglycerol hydrolase [Vicinamibacterales bacterium]
MTLTHAVRTVVALLIVAAGVTVELPSASAFAALPATPAVQAATARQTITIRGHEQVLRLYGTRSGKPVIVSSGDGGWIHLGPQVAEVLAAKGYFVVGFDAKAYLESFTNGTTTLRVEEEPGDYRTLIDFTARETGQKPILIGVSEGAGLSVLAATDPANKEAIAGVIGLGLSDLTELGWRWKDMVIYLTHGTPQEPTFSVRAIVDRVAPIPVAAIHSTRDEYVPLAEVQQVLESGREPKRLWIVTASNHRFSDNVPEFDRALLEAIAWIAEVHPGVAR